MGRIVHLIVRLAAAAVAIAIVLTALLSMRLAAGPISLGDLAPSVARLLEEITPYTYEIGDIWLLWRDWQQGPLVKVHNARVIDDKDAVGADIRELTVGFSAVAMTQAVVAPTVVQVSGARITIDQQKLTAPSEDEGDGDGLDDVLKGLYGPPDASHPLSFLRAVGLSEVAINVRNASEDGAAAASDWRLTVSQAELARDDARRLIGNAALALMLGEERSDVTVALAPTVQGALQVDLTLAGLRPAALAVIDPALTPLVALDVPLEGSGRMEIDAAGRVGSATVGIHGKGGSFNLNDTVAHAVGVASPPQRLKVHRLALQASYEAVNTKVAVQALEIAFEPGTVLYVPAPVDHRFPLKELTAAGVYENGKLDIRSFDLGFDALKLAVTGSVDKLDTAPTGTFAVSADNIRVDDLGRYWPPTLAPGAWEWCTTHLRDGIVPRLDARLAFETHDGTTDVTDVSVKFPVERLTVDYLPPMPPARGASGVVTIDPNSLRIVLNRADAAGLTISDGAILILGLKNANQILDLDLLVAGPVPAAVELLTSRPLQYPQRVDIRPEQASGETTTRLRMRFPLLDDVDEEDMQVDAEVALTNFGLTNIVKGVDVRSGQARLHVDTGGLRGDGRLTVAGIEGAFRLAASFVDGVEPQATVQFVAADIPVARVRRELAQALDVDGYLIGGTFGGSVSFELSSSGAGVVNASLDLARASLAIPEIGWHKPAGAAGVADAIIRLQDDHLGGTSELALLAPGLDVGGTLRTSSKGETETVSIHRMIAGRTNVTGTIARHTDGRWDIELSGIALDLSPMLRADEEKGRGAKPAAGQSPFDKLPDFSVTADLETLWLNAPDPIRALQATVVHEGGRWSLVQMHGNLADHSSVTMSIAPDDEGGRSVLLEADNAGEALRAFDVIGDVRGGTLEARGRFDDTDPLHPLTGRVKVRNFHVVNAPILARLLSIMAVGGIRDALTGRGIAFAVFDMPFSLREEKLDITDGRTFGWSLGITFGGRVDTGTQMVDVTGRLVPFYAVNNALGRLPLIGLIMTGGDRGGGVFSAGYRVVGPLSDPTVSVNPASVLFPGFLRWLLAALSNWAGPGVTDVEAGFEAP